MAESYYMPQQRFVGDGDKLGEKAPCGNQEESGEGKDDARGGDGARDAKAFEERDDRGKEECE